MRSWYNCSFGELLETSDEEVVAVLARTSAQKRLSPNPETDTAWQASVREVQSAASLIIQASPEAEEWRVCFEFELPRRRRRIDTIILARDVIYLIEFKVGATSFDRAARWQTEQYAMDLRDFHFGSRGSPVLPILIATNATASDPIEPQVRWDVGSVQTIAGGELGSLILQTYGHLTDNTREPLNALDWEDSPYRPTPTIVDAARMLYQGHDVREIASADTQNLDSTVQAVAGLVVECRKRNAKGIAFITGSPGSGKTLAGLQVAHDPQLQIAGENAGVFLSGNMPLVEVILEALAAEGEGTRAERKRKLTTFIQHAYAFRNEYAEEAARVPHEHVVLFDEAQRAWDARQVTAWTKGRSVRSEPQILLDVMSRHEDWAVVVAMVGGGQEINRGEAGLGEWGRALATSHRDWLVRASPAVLPRSASLPGGRLYDAIPIDGPVIVEDARLHLQMNVRSPRAERLNRWVDLLLDLDPISARNELPDAREFPIALTRSLDVAKDWLRDRTDDEQRCGLVACSSAKRLRAWGLDTGALKQGRSWGDWFLKPRGDVRASFQLEVPATNFDCQGLELDWVGVCWGNDLANYPFPATWQIREFKGSKWVSASEERARFILNSYRVLLTRARRGQVIWVPKPDGRDASLDPSEFDAIAKLLQEAGAHDID